MGLAKLNKAEGRSYCDRISRGLAGMSAQIEVMSLDSGDRTEADWLPLYGITYDPKSDVLEIAARGHRSPDQRAARRLRRADSAGPRRARNRHRRRNAADREVSRAIGIALAAGEVPAARSSAELSMHERVWFDLAANCIHSLAGSGERRGT